MVHGTVEREAEKKNLQEQIRTQSLAKPWVEVCWEQDGCDEEQVQRINRWQSQPFGELHQRQNSKISSVTAS